MPHMIVVAGEALIDRIVGPDGSVVERPGGGPFNTVRTIARLGVPAAFVGCLSTDPPGNLLRATLEADGVDLTRVVSTGAPTTLAIARMDDDGTATYEFVTDGTSATRLPAAAIRLAMAAGPPAVHVGTLGLVLQPLATRLADAVAGPEAGPLVMVDPNCRPSAITDRSAYLARIVRIVHNVDIVKASRADLDYLWPGMPVAVAAHRLLAGGATAVIVTDGSDPVACYTAEWTTELDVPERPIVDTIGAGDAFGGAFLARWIERGLGRGELMDEATVRDALALAIEVAGLTCARAGADPPRRDELGGGLKAR